MATENDKAVLNSILSPLLPLSNIYGVDTNETEDDIIAVNEVERQAKKLEIEAIKLAEAGNLDSSLDLLTTAVETAPKRAAVYNNRAQVYRMLGLDTKALHDLDTAITLTDGGKTKSGCQALCQRALLLEKLGHKQEAINDWTAAARNGNQYAKSKLVQMNPYAALCNQMLQVMTTITVPNKSEENQS